MTRNKWLVTVIVFIGMVAFGVGSACADPRSVAVQASADANGNTTLSAFPAGTKLLNVHVWNDRHGSKQKELGSVSTFKLGPCDGFNFIWQDSQGSKWYQMITPASRPGGVLQTDCSWVNPKSGQHECKYLFPSDDGAPCAQ